MSKLTLDEAIKHCEEVAELNEAQAEKIDRQFIGSAMDKCATDCRECAAEHRQFAEWLTELKEWKENPFWQIKTECKKNYDCNNCAFLNHCPFAHGNSVASEYPMNWIVY